MGGRVEIPTKHLLGIKIYLRAFDHLDVFGRMGLIYFSVRLQGTKAGGIYSGGKPGNRRGGKEGR